MPITTGPTDRRTEINAENLILRVGSSVWQSRVASHASQEASGPGQVNYTSSLTRGGRIDVQLQERCCFLLKIYAGFLRVSIAATWLLPDQTLASEAGLVPDCVDESRLRGAEGYSPRPAGCMRGNVNRNTAKVPQSACTRWWPLNYKQVMSSSFSAVFLSFLLNWNWTYTQLLTFANSNI